MLELDGVEELPWEHFFLLIGLKFNTRLGSVVFVGLEELEFGSATLVGVEVETFGAGISFNGVSGTVSCRASQAS